MQFDNIIIDSNNLYHRNYYTHKDLQTKIKEEVIFTGGIYGFLISLNKIERLYLKKGGTVYLCFDNMSSTDNLRKNIDPDYKANREKKETPFYRGIDFLQLILLNHSEHYKVIYKTAYEADDYVKPLVNALPNTSDILLVSEDLDWARAIDKNVLWLNKGEIWDLEKFKEKHSFYPTNNNLMIYKAFKGDKADNIPIAIPGFRTKDILKLMENYNSVYDIIGDIKNIDCVSDTWKKALLKNKTRLILNYQLVSYIEIEKEDLKDFTQDCSFNATMLSEIYKLLKFKVSEVDKRILSKFPTKKKDNDFFGFQTRDRK